MGVGKRLKTALGYSGRTETTVLPECPVVLDATVLMESQAEAIEEAGRPRQGLTIFTDGARARNGAAGYAVVWKSGQQWVGVESHMAYNQEAFDAECAALARALEVAARRRTIPERVTIFTDAQAAIRRMGSDEPGPGQKYAIEGRRWIAALRKSRPEIDIGIRNMDEIGFLLGLIKRSVRVLVEALWTRSRMHHNITSVLYVLRLGTFSPIFQVV
jgi:hypothetical protein